MTSPLKARLAALERKEIELAVEAAHGNVREAAKSLGISERSAWLKIQRYKIEPGAYRHPTE